MVFAESVDNIACTNQRSKPPMSHKLSLTVLAIASCLAFGASAQDYPSKDKVVTIVVPFAAGGPTDRVARDLAEALRKPMGGVSVVVDNTAGAGSSTGSAKVARAAPAGRSSHRTTNITGAAQETETPYVPKNGPPPAITDLIGGQIDLLCD